MDHPSHDPGNLPAKIAAQIGINEKQAVSTIELLDGGNTIPFIARYRKEVTGGMDEEQIRQLASRLARERALNDRRSTVLKSIDEQGMLTTDLRQQIEAADNMTRLEDLYQPYKPKQRTRASIARDKGLQPLADLILQQVRVNQSLEILAAPYINDHVTNQEEAWGGARDIVAETISNHPEVRRRVREKAYQEGGLQVEKAAKAEDPRGVYSLYYDFEMRIGRLKPHQVLALNRGQAEKVLRVKLDIPAGSWQSAMLSVIRPDPRSPLMPLLQEAITDAAERLLLPAIERDIHRDLTEKAEAHAVRVFGENLRALLCQPPLIGQVVLGIDPGFRTGCKVAIVDATGKVLDTDTIYPHEPQKRRDEALNTLARLVARHSVTLITIGNGTASRETEQLVADLIRALDTDLLGKKRVTQSVRYLIVNEAGASVYSASVLARAELPDMDVTLRGAVSIARRAQDPLAELVKIDPQSIGVGLYQHDVDQKMLNDTLTGVVESVVNQVGVDANTASIALLTYVSGIGPKLAGRIVAYRNENGAFESRNDLRKVSGLGPKAFEQCAGFLRIRDGDNSLDASAIHPESYPVAEAVLRRAGLTASMPPEARKPALDALLQRVPIKTLAAETGCGELTLADILEQLVRPGRDPRLEAAAPILRSDVLSMDDLKVGMRLKGTIRNVVDFGAFVDIGVKQDGLLHISQVPRGTVLRVGDVMDVEILKVEAERGRIGLGWSSPAVDDRQRNVK